MSLTIVEPLPQAVNTTVGINDDMASMESEEMQQRDFKAKWSELMGHPNPVMHKKVSVLMLYWNPDKKITNIDVSEEVHQLGQVFETYYRYKVIKRMFDTTKFPQHQAFKHVIDFVDEEDDENGLLIIYYAGHGGTQAAGLGQITLSGKTSSSEKENKDTSIEWSLVEGVLSKTKADVLEIFDCCHAGLLCAPAEQTRSLTRSFEILTACAHNQRTPTPGPHSFTTALVWALKELARSEGFFTNQLNAKIREYPDFSRNQQPQLFPSRFDPSGDYLHMAPVSGLRQQPSGTTRSKRNEEVEKEQMLDLRFHYKGEISGADLEHLTNALKVGVLRRADIKAHRVTALGRYNFATYDLRRRNMMKHVSATWIEAWIGRGKRRAQSARHSNTGDSGSPVHASDGALVETCEEPGTPSAQSMAPDHTSPAPFVPELLTPGPSEQGSRKKRLRSGGGLSP